MERGNAVVSAHAEASQSFYKVPISRSARVSVHNGVEQANIARKSLPQLFRIVLLGILPLETSHGRCRADDEGGREVGRTLKESPRYISLLKVLGHCSDWPHGFHQHGRGWLPGQEAR